MKLDLRTALHLFRDETSVDAFGSGTRQDGVFERRSAFTAWCNGLKKETLFLLLVFGQTFHSLEEYS